VPSCADPFAERRLDNVLLRMALVDAMESLSPSHREVLLHLHYRDRTNDETARLLGIPAGTVKSRRHEAALRMRQVLQERGIADR
jgi:RNA polymerase sigma-70 factor (ECF subfamily)